MKKSFLLVFLLLNQLAFGQSFSIEAETQPYFNIVEWKGLGAVLMSRDPSLSQRQIKLTAVGSEGKTIWQQVFNPITPEVEYIAEEGGKYVYFIEGLEPKNGKVIMHQVSIAGNVKTTNVNFFTPIKQLGNYQQDQLELIDVVCTDKSLVYLFRHDSKADKKVTTIAVSMTHHNFLCYASVIAENVSGSSKVEDQVSWYVAGENAQNIVYATRTMAGKDAGWRIKEFNPKGDFINEFTIPSTGLKFTAHARIGFGRRGSALLQKVEPKEEGTLMFANGAYYVAGIVADGTTALLQTYKWENKQWQSMATSKIANYSAKKNFELGYFQQKEGLSCFVKHVSQEAHFHNFNGNSLVAGNTSSTSSNPSRLLTDLFPNQFIVNFADQWLLFDTKQLPAKAPMKFEYLKK